MEDSDEEKETEEYGADHGSSGHQQETEARPDPTSGWEFDIFAHIVQASTVGAGRNVTDLDDFLPGDVLNVRPEVFLDDLADKADVFSITRATINSRVSEWKRKRWVPKDELDQLQTELDEVRKFANALRGKARPQPEETDPVRKQEQDRIMQTIWSLGQQLHNDYYERNLYINRLKEIEPGTPYDSLSDDDLS